MEKSSPFIKRFQTKNNYYIYDVNTNRILLVNKMIFETVPLLGGYSKDESFHKLSQTFTDLEKSDFDEQYEKIQALIKQYNVFSPAKPKAKGFHDVLEKGEIENYYNKEKIKSLILEITQQCNLRCRYCSFSGTYKFSRTHNSNCMSFSTAKKAIDFYIKNSSDSDLVKNICFYGGEPLLQFDTIRKCTEYAYERTGRKIRIRIASNGTLLNEEIMDFLMTDLKLSMTNIEFMKTGKDLFRIL
jgi:uncharacterized protein